MRFWKDLVPLVQEPTKYKQKDIIRLIRERIKTKGEKPTMLLNKNKKGITFEEGEQVLVKACNVANTAAG